MSNLDKIATAFSVVHTQKQFEKLEDKIFSALEQVSFPLPEDESSLVKILKGDRGERGAQGESGPIGERGEQGLQGIQGIQGEKGDRGERGREGQQGEVGPAGPKGDRGDPGRDAPDYRKEFEEALSQFNKRLNDNQKEATKGINAQIRRLSSLAGGGGSNKIVDNADVDKQAILNVEDDAILIYDRDNKKFVAQSFVSVLDRLRTDLEVQYNKLVDAESNFTYIGEAVPGSTTDAAVWRIKRVEEVSGVGGDDYNILWADGTADFDKVWNNRATFSYS